jgi:hypothetical protein
MPGWIGTSCGHTVAEKRAAVRNSSIELAGLGRCQLYSHTQLSELQGPNWRIAQVGTSDGLLNSEAPLVKRAAHVNDGRAVAIARFS